MDGQISFGRWLEKRRKALDLTREELAQKVGCSISTLRKIESDERRPSKQLAELIADALDIRTEERATFLRIARGELAIERMKSSPPLPDFSLLQISQPLSTPIKSIPVPPTPLIGREMELTTLREMIHDPQCRLITLFGPGGIGKTRLAIETAIQQKREYSQAVAFVSLASLSSVSLLVHAIADALGFSFWDPGEPKTQLIDYLREKNLLLVLDNFEHLLDGVNLLVEVIQFAPEVKILCTSREQLNVQGEWVFEVRNLSAPDAEALFVNCAHRVLSDFLSNEANRQKILQICRLVEGMPLAIELAATWLRILSLTEIEHEVQNSLEFLSTTMRDLPERHRSIRAVFDHSWELLTDEERIALSCLSVFHGGFTREAGVDVAGASLFILSSLISKSLVRLTEAGRYDLHELIRQYTLVHLMINPEMFEETKERHLKFYLALAETADPHLRGSGQLEWLSRLEKEYDNLRSAMEWSLKDDLSNLHEHYDLALRLVGALRWFWQIRGYFHEGCVWLERALDRSRSELAAVPMPSLENTTHLRNLGAQACALEGLALLTNSLGDHGTAHTLAEQSAALYQKLGDKRGLAAALMILGQTHHWRGEVSLSHSRLGEALALYREAGDQWNIARSLYRLGTYLADFGGDVAGCAMLEESSAILEKLGDKYLFVNVLVAQGVISLGSCNYSQARVHFERSLTIAREIRDPWEVADALTNIGCILRIQGDYGSANSYYEEAFRIYQEGGRGIWCTDPLCALAENDIAQGHLVDAHLRLQDASTYAETSDNKWVQTLIGYFQGLLTYYEGDLESSTKCLEEVIALARESQYKPDLARALVTLGRVMNVRGEKTKATMLLGEGISLFQKMNSRLGIAMALEGFAELVLPENPENAINFMKAAESIRDSIGAPLPPIDRPSYEREVATVRAQLGEEGFAEEWVKAEPWTTVVMELVTNFNP